MAGKLFIALLALVLGGSCSELRSKTTIVQPNTSQPSPVSKPLEPSKPEQLVGIKDKTPAASVLTALPLAADSSGWKRTQTMIADPKDLPKIRPPSNTEYYRAEKTIGNKNRSISVVFGDLLHESDAIVNAANTSLLGGGGIDGAIHNAARINGEDLLRKEGEAYNAFRNASFSVGSAMVMNSYGLAPGITMVVFAVGPSIAQGILPTDHEKLLLYSAVYNSLLKASEYRAKNVSSVLISSGIFNFPKLSAAELHFRAALQFFKDHPNTSIESFRLVNFDKPTVESTAEAFLAIFP